MLRQLQNTFRPLITRISREHRWPIIKAQKAVDKLYKELILDVVKMPGASIAKLLYKAFNLTARLITISGLLKLLFDGVNWLYSQDKVGLAAFEKSIYLSAGGLLLLAFLYFLKSAFGRTQRFSPDVKFPGKYVKIVSKGLYNVSVVNINEDKFKFAGKSDAAMSAIINMKAFENSIWQTTHPKKYERNKSHILRNAYTIQLIKSIESDEYIGFTHVLPVSKRVWSMYVNSKIDDNNFDYDYILPDSIPEYEDVYGLIMFSFGFAFADVDFKNEVVEGDYYGELMEQAWARHLNHFLENTFPAQPKVKVLFTNADDVSLMEFEDEALNGKMMSKDNTPIYIIEVTKMAHGVPMEL